MADGFIGSLLNPNAMPRPGGVAQRNDLAMVPPRTVEGQVMQNGSPESPELPPSVNRTGPRGDQALSQYQVFSGSPGNTSAGAGFSAVV